VAALAKFSIADGFRVELAASEPLVTDPVAMAFDERGRLYVVEMRGYSENPDDQLGQVRLLEDVDDDGLFDKSSIFLDKLSWPTAIACYDGGVLVGVAPDILFCRDTDGDRRADVREVVFTGFARDNVQGLLNSFVWGLDQRLYGATSSSGGEVRALRHPQQPPIDLGHRDFAIDPRTMNLVAVSGGGQHGLSFDRFGNRYASANSDHIQLFEMDERYLDRNPLLANSNPRRSIAADGPAAEVYRTSPVEPWRIVRTRLRVKGMVSGPIEGGGRAAGYFTGATGVTIYTGDAFPDPYRQQTFAFIGDVGGNLVHQKRVDDNGLSKIARRVDEGREFLASSDNWFRPVQFANGPDGALYVLDMYRETIEHPLSLPPLIKQHLDLTSGRDRGRIYRVVPATYQRRSRPLPGNASLGELIGMLAHPNGWHRETAARMLLAGDPAQVGPALARAVRSRWQKTAGKDSAWEANPAYVPDAIVRALYCLEVLGKLTSADLSAALRDEDAEVRRHAIPLVEGRFGGPGGQDLVRQLVQMVSDPDPHVREQIALTLGDLPPEMKLAPLARLVAQTTAIDGDDSLWRTAILSSVGDCRVDFALRLLTRSSNLPQPFSDRLLQELIEEIGRGVTRSSPHSGAQLVTLIATLRRLPDSAPARQWIGTLLVSSKIQGDQLAEFLQQDGLADAATWLASLADQARAMAMKEGESGTERGEALRLLRIVAPAKAIEVARDFLVPGQLFDLQLVAVEVLGSYRNPIASEILLRRVSDMQTGAKRRAYDLLLQRRESSRLVAEGLLAGRVPVADLTASQRAALLANEKGGEPDRLGELFTRAEAARQQVLERYQDVLASTGDVPRGREVFRRVCASCHRLEEQGFAVGPDLAVLVSRGAAFLMTNILDPNREIDPRYESYLIVTADGRTLTGIIRGETGSAVEIALANGVQESIPRSEIAEMRGTGLSLMPVGMEQDITPEAMADLLAYLQSLDRLRATGTDVGP
jgi:putative membrane-bound dehydrogenase-like protein